jgi:hypothetical protein
MFAHRGSSLFVGHCKGLSIDARVGAVQHYGGQDWCHQQPEQTRRRGSSAPAPVAFPCIPHEDLDGGNLLCREAGNHCRKDTSLCARVESEPVQDHQQDPASGGSLGGDITRSFNHWMQSSLKRVLRFLLPA